VGIAAAAGDTGSDSAHDPPRHNGNINDTVSMKKIQTQRGFTLLLSIIVGVVILTIGTTVLNSTLKQFVLSEISQESERAFHAAYAGVECAQYWNVGDYWDVGTGTRQVRCVGQNVMTTPVPTGSKISNADAEYTVAFSWQNASVAVVGDTSFNMCTSVTVHKYFKPSATTDMSVAGGGVLPNTLSNAEKICAAGVECTVVESRGYNRPCGSLNDIRTVEREVTVRF
jgi:hypothetical protein